MKHQKFNWLSLIGLILLLGLITACGGGTDTTTEEESEVPAATESSESEEVADEEAMDEEAMDEEAMDEGAMDDLPEVCDGQDGHGMKIGFGNLGESVPFAVQVREGIESVAADCNVEIVNGEQRAGSPNCHRQYALIYDAGSGRRHPVQRPWQYRRLYLRHRRRHSHDCHRHRSRGLLRIYGC